MIELSRVDMPQLDLHSPMKPARPRNMITQLGEILACGYDLSLL